MIYADYNGSAPLCPEVRQYMIKRMEGEQFANPNAIHPLATKIMMGIENSRAVCANVLGAKHNQLIFNSGSTEGVANVFFTLLDGIQPKDKPVILISGIEHSAVIKTAEYYQKKGFVIEKVPTFENGLVDLDYLEHFLKNRHSEVAMCSVMAANNETGVIQDYKRISRVCSEFSVPYFSDTTQLIGKDDFNFTESGIDYALLSGHKVGSLTGIGLMMTKDVSKLKTLIIGGGQERDKRGGTQHYLGIETLAIALDAFQKNKGKLAELRARKEQFERMIQKDFPEVVVVGQNAPRLASTSLIALPGIHGQAVQIELETKKIYVTTSSACSDNEPATSKVLKAMNVGDAVGRGVVRISLGLCSDPQTYTDIYHGLKAAYLKLSKVKCS